jgi:hypothetical protein
VFKRVAEDSSSILHFSVEFIPHMWECLLVASRHTNNQQNQPMKNKIEIIIETLPTYNQRMAAEAILDLLVEGAINEREAKRQLAVNEINI